jgi:serine/threonine protein kinase
MEYAEGITLEYYIKMVKNIAFENRKKIIGGILNGLSEMSKHHILHRDIKPENIIVSKDLSSVKIVDFGLATNVNE